MRILTKLIQASAKILEKRTTANKKESVFDEIVGYSDIKKEFVKALDSTSPVSILLCGPPGCGKSEFQLVYKITGKMKANKGVKLSQ